MSDLNEEGCLRLLAAVVLQWWRDAEQIGDHEALAAFLGMDEPEVRSRRPLRIDEWRRKRYVAVDGGQKGESDVYF